MDATTMAKITSFVAKLKADFPGVALEASDDFYWAPATSTVYFNPDSPLSGRATLLHEMAHALLDHRHFERDIDLLKIERAAWDYARDTLAPRYGVTIEDDTVEDMIDTYREWLHARSKCPSCTMTGIQTVGSTYYCLGCNHSWKVNDARRCGLKRYSLAI
jgi:hypothetical protein